jgi:hypothetical protein
MKWYAKRDTARMRVFHLVRACPRIVPSTCLLILINAATKQPIYYITLPTAVKD